MIISTGVWLHRRFALNFCDVEHLTAHCGVIVPQQNGSVEKCCKDRAGNHERLLLTSLRAIHLQSAISCQMQNTILSVMPIIEQRTRINRHEEESVKCSDSNQPIKRNDFSLYMRA